MANPLYCKSDLIYSKHCFVKRSTMKMQLSVESWHSTPTNTQSERRMEGCFPAMRDNKLAIQFWSDLLHDSMILVFSTGLLHDGRKSSHFLLNLAYKTQSVVQPVRYSRVLRVCTSILLLGQLLNQQLDGGWHRISSSLPPSGYKWLTVYFFKHENRQKAKDSSNLMKNVCEAIDNWKLITIFGNRLVT